MTNPNPKAVEAAAKEISYYYGEDACSIVDEYGPVYVWDQNITLATKVLRAAQPFMQEWLPIENNTPPHRVLQLVYLGRLTSDTDKRDVAMPWVEREKCLWFSGQGENITQYVTDFMPLPPPRLKQRVCDAT